MNTTMSVGSFISFGWETFKKRSWFLIGATIVWFVLNWCAGFVGGFIGGFLGAFLGSGVASLASRIVSLALNTLLAMGWLAFVIKTHDDTASATLSAFWHPQKFWSYLGTTILLGIIVVVGFILFIIPGFMAFTAFMFAPYFVIDKGLGPIEALKASARITKGNRMRVLGLFAATGLIGLLGVVALIVGLFVALPIIVIACVHAYRRLSAAADANEARQPLTGGEITLVVVGGLLPVLIIVGLLSSVVLLSLNSARAKGTAAQAGVNLNLLRVDLELYFDGHNNSYPVALSDMSADSQTAPSIGSIPLGNFTYTQLKNGKAYRLCSNSPVSTGNTCVTSDSTGTATTPVPIPSLQ